MAIVTNRSQAARQVAEDTAKKMKSEDVIAMDLRRLFREIGIDFAVFYATTGAIINFGLYHNELVGLLRKNYRLVSRKFDNNIRESLKPSDIPAGANALIATRILSYINTHSEQQSRIILNTTSNDLNSDLNETISAAAIEGRTLTQEQVAEETRKTFTRKSINRTGTIATTEINNISETTKFLEAGILVAAGATYAGKLLSDSANKQWNTVGDEKVRLSHAKAERQRVPLNEPFIVQGQQLMHPGDTSLGASVDNIINCRCSSTIVRI